MSWLTFTTDHVTQGLSAAELTALRTQQLASGQSDPLPDVVTRTTYEVRGYVAANNGQLVGEPGSIPEELLSTAIAIARWHLLTRLPVKALVTDSRRQEYMDAVALLRDVAAGKFAVSIASSPDTDQPRPQAQGSWGSIDVIPTH